jgi:hypothetical protein
MTVQSIPTPRTMKTLIDPLDTGNNASGFQRAQKFRGRYTNYPSVDCCINPHFGQPIVRCDLHHIYFV